MTAASPPQVAAGSPPARRRSSDRRAPGRPPTHGAALLTRALRGVPLDQLDRRGQVGRALRRVQAALVSQLGGEPSPAEKILIEEAAKARVIAAAVGDWLLRQETGLVRDGELIAVVMQHSALVANLARLLRALGLRHRAKRAASLQEFIANRTTPSST